MQIKAVTAGFVTIEFFDNEILRIAIALKMAGLSAGGSSADPESFGVPVNTDTRASDWFEQTAAALDMAALASYLADYLPREQRRNLSLERFLRRDLEGLEGLWGDCSADGKGDTACSA